MATLAAGLLAAVIWSVLGRIPVAVEGQGLLVFPQNVRSFHAPASGQIVSLGVHVGDKIDKHEVVGSINQAEVQQRLEHERIRLAEVKARDAEIIKLNEQRLELEMRSIERERRRIQERIESVTRVAEERKKKNDSYFRQQTENLQQLNTLTERLGKSVDERFERFKDLFEKGMARQDEVFDAERESISHDVQLADLGLRMHEIELKRIEAEGEYLRQMDLIADLQSKLNDLDVLASKLELSQTETVSDSALRIQEIERNIARLERELATKGTMVCEYNGRVLEVTGAVGQFVREGQRLGAIAIENTEEDLVAVVYYDVSDGKRIEPGMSALISPTTVQRARFGSMVGTVKEVSAFPVTTDAVTNVLGNAEVAQRLTAGADRLQVECELQIDPSSHSGFRWTSGKGPDASVAGITSGTTVVVYTTIEHRRPISYVIPLLRRWSGS